MFKAGGKENLWSRECDQVRHIHIGKRISVTRKVSRCFLNLPVTKSLCRIILTKQQYTMHAYNYFFHCVNKSQIYLNISQTPFHLLFAFTFVTDRRFNLFSSGFDFFPERPVKKKTP